MIVTQQQPSGWAAWNSENPSQRASSETGGPGKQRAIEMLKKRFPQLQLEQVQTLLPIVVDPTAGNGLHIPQAQAGKPAEPPQKYSEAFVQGLSAKNQALEEEVRALRAESTSVKTAVASANPPEAPVIPAAPPAFIPKCSHSGTLEVDPGKGGVRCSACGWSS